jgi:hypothetical protein
MPITSTTARLSLLLLAFWISAEATAGQSVWTSLGGPAGGTTLSLAIDSATPETFYASVAEKGLFRSTDAGAHWTRLGGDLPPGQVPYLLVSNPGHPGTLFAAFSQPQRVFETGDGGSTWRALEGAPFVGLDWLAFGSGSPAVGYAFNGSWYASTDGGETWQLQGTPPFGYVSLIAVDANLASTAAVFADQQVFVTRDGGAHWMAATSGLPDDDQVQGLLFDPKTAGRLFAWMAFRGVFRSDDAGSHWQPAGLSAIDGDIQGALWALTVTADGSRLYAGTRRGTDSGSEIYEIYVRERGASRWRLGGPEAVSSPLPPLFLVADPLDPLTLLAGTWGRGLALSHDGGITWTYRDDGFDAARIASLIADPRHRRVYYAGDVASRIWLTRDDGATWELLAEDLGAILAIDPRRPHTLYANGPSRSDDGGKHWTSLAAESLFSCQFFGRLVVDPLDSTLYLLLEGNNGFGCHNPGNVIYKRLDRGRIWTVVPEPTGGVNDLAIGVQHAQPEASVLFALTYAGVERSTDGGDTWSASSQGLGQLNGTIGMAVSANSRVLYLNSGDGIFRSVDGAVRWERRGADVLAPSGFLTLTVDPLAPDTVYGYGGGRFFRSLDGCASWMEFSAGLSRLHLTGPLAVDSMHPGRIRAASENSGVIEIQLP